MTSNPQNSFVEIGSFDNGANLKSGANSITLTLSQNFFWLVQIPAVKIGDSYEVLVEL